MAKRMSRKEILAALVVRQNWLTDKIAANKAIGKPHGYASEEWSAIEYAVKLIKSRIQADFVAAHTDASKGAAPTCAWRQESEGIEDHLTDCGHTFEFVSEPPHEWMRFCCYCGRPTWFMRASEEEDVA